MVVPGYRFKIGKLSRQTFIGIKAPDIISFKLILRFYQLVLGNGCFLKAFDLFINKLLQFLAAV